jgi:hypothetical protein
MFERVIMMTCKKKIDAKLIGGLCFSTASGAAIAPPPSLTETSSPAPMEPPPKMAAPQGGGSLAGLGIAAKIMAKYGYKVI